MLKDGGTDPPSVQYPPKTTRGTFHADGDDSPTRPAMQQQQQQPQQHQDTGSGNGTIVHESTSPESLPDDAIGGSQPSSGMDMDGARERTEAEPTQGTPIEDKNQDLVSRLLSTRGHLSFDQLSGRLRYYGPTVNSHIYSELAIDGAKQNREMLEQTRRAEKIIRTLPLETHDYGKTVTDI